MLKESIKNNAKEMIDRLVENIIDVPDSNKSGFCVVIRSNYIIPIMLESPDSTLVLDMDQTMIHAADVTEDLLERIKNQEVDLTRRDDSPDLKDLSEFKKALQNYKYKEQVSLVEHPRQKLIIFRPKVKEFLSKVGHLIKSKDLKDSIVYTANNQDWAEIITKELNKFAGTNLDIWGFDNTDPLHPDSVLIDDSPFLAKAKLDKSEIVKDAMKNLSQDVSDSWIQINPFHGNLKDNELPKVMNQLQKMI